MTDKIDTVNTARAPMRKRGIERFEHLLDAAAAILGERPDEDISLAQIAEKAGVPLASVYHFFPNRNAALEALAKRYHQRIGDLAMIDGQGIPDRWQDLFASRIRRSAAYLNSEPAALRLFMGAGVSAEIRNVDVEGNARTSPDLPDQQKAAHRTFTVKGRRTWFETIEEMQVVLDDWIISYNTKRPHQGRNMAGRTPRQAFIDGLKNEPVPAPQKTKGGTLTKAPKQASMQPETSAA